ncbi:Mannosylfructose-phosphate synthase [Vibrio aerogenes CECT 7868]|uniref:Mannosylfructose-phosphate synthase n=1 Tax=Vibrio aerogenes CECT 7868 TaxID=1216006 RepID=A0A1M5ZDM4_9VIBR|nr:glycosyltransferase family 4 protein [Vibrio aerogenes]SHI22103.1 Mannosylfructose-phosphate synthase [Vibrio aerogenes CECT 7868]
MATPVILHICLSEGWGGLEMYPIRVGSRLSQAGYQIFGLCLQKTQVHHKMKQSGIPVFSAKSKSTLLSRDFFSLVRWIKARKITVIHCHKSGDLVFGRLIRLFCPVRVVFTEHMGSRREKKDVYHRWVYRGVDLVLSVSDSTYRRNIHALPVPEEKVSRLWLGTDIPDVLSGMQENIAEIKRDMGIPDSLTILGTVGRICEGKGHIELVRAFRLIEQQYPRTLLVIVGGVHAYEGCDQRYLQRLKQVITELRLEDKVIFTGFMSDVQQALSVIDVVCLPYANEAFGLTAIEAMAAQKPIVGANTGAFPEIFAETALLCNPRDEQDIANQVMTLMTEKNLADCLAGHARRRAVHEFSMEKHIQGLIDFYSDLVSRSVVLAAGLE